MNTLNLFDSKTRFWRSDEVPPTFATQSVNSCLAASQEPRLLYLQKLPRRSPLLRTICIEFPSLGNLLHKYA